jgi:intraflagellar transport protein 88
MMASCHRRSGNYHKALDTYKSIHRRFPDNVECLKFLVRLCTDLGMPEAKEYANKAKKLDKVRELREQRIGSASGGSAMAAQRRLGSAVRGGSAGQASAGRISCKHARRIYTRVCVCAAVSRGSLRTASAHIDFANDDGEYQMTNKREIGIHNWGIGLYKESASCRHVLFGSARTSQRTTENGCRR